MPTFEQVEIQYSHLAVLENMQKGNGSLFHPKSYNLNPSGGGENQLYDGTADARFPLIHSVISLFGERSSLENRFVFGCISMLFFLIACYLTVLLAYYFSNDWFYSIVTGASVNISKTLLFAQFASGQFTFTYTLLLLGIYLVLKSVEDTSKKNLFFVGAVGAFGLASLMGHGSIYYLLGVVCLAIYKLFDNNEKREFPWGIVVAVLFIGIFCYNRFYLFKLNGGLFELVDKPYTMSLTESVTNYTNFIAASFVSIYTGSIFGLGFLFWIYSDHRNLIKLDRSLIYLFFLIALPLLYYLLTNAYSLCSYEFYNLENLFPAILVVSVYFGSHLNNKLRLKKVLGPVTLIVLSLFSVSLAIARFQDSLLDLKYNQVVRTLENLKFAPSFLDSLKIPKNEKITVINGYGGNMSLMLSERSGYATEGRTKADFIEVLSHDDSKYILSQDEFFMFDVVNAYPEAMLKMELIASDEILSVYKKVDNKSSGNVLNDYVKAHNKKNYYVASTNFESVPVDSLPGAWTFHGNIVDEKSLSGTTGMFIDKETQFPCTFRVKPNELDSFYPLAAVVTANFFTERELWKMGITVSCHGMRDGQEVQLDNSFYKVSKKLKGDAVNNWTRISCKINLPQDLLPEDEIRVYIWNPSKGEFYIDDFEMVFY